MARVTCVQTETCWLNRTVNRNKRHALSHSWKIRFCVLKIVLQVMDSWSENWPWGRSCNGRVWCISRFGSRSCFIFSQTIRASFRLPISVSAVAKFYTSEIQETTAKSLTIKISRENRWGERPASRLALFNLSLFLNIEKKRNSKWLSPFRAKR